MKRERIKQCLEENLSGLYMTEGQHRRMMNGIITEGKKVKKKLSAAIVLLAILLITATTATAAVLLNSLFEKTMDMEMEHGPFSTWSLDEKTELIGLLSENGWPFSEEELSRLQNEQIADSEKEQLATQMIVNLFGRADAISHMDIIESVKGPMSTWSLVDKAWYSDYIQSKKTLIDSWRDILPEENDLTREEAVKIAKEAILAAHPITDAELENRIVNVSFFVNQDHQEPCWLISWQTDPYAASAYTVLLTRTGEIIEDAALEVYTPAHMANRMMQEGMGENAEDAQRPQGREEQWSLEDKVKWLSDENGIPADGEISEERAAEIACQTLKAQGIETNKYEMSVWYKLYDPYAADDSLQTPFYVVYFTDDLNAPKAVYSVVIDPKTGEIQRVYTPNNHPGNG